MDLSIKVAEIFRPLLSPSRYKGAHGGRGSGKSHFFAGTAVALCIQSPGSRIVCAREVQRSLRDSVKLLVEDKIREFGVENHFKIMYDHIRTPGQGLIVFQGLQDHTAESIKSLEGFDAAYLEEAHTITKRSLELLRPTIRKPGSQIWASWNPRLATDPIDTLLRGEFPPPSSIVVKADWRDNPWFPESLEEERSYDEIVNPVRYAHIWEGEYEPQVVGALWNREMIIAGRVNAPPHLKRVVIGVDPPTSSEEDADECGIIAVGLGDDGHGYVLADESIQGKPETWARRVVALHDILEANTVVAEVNQGGDMVEHTIHSVRKAVRVIKVRAIKGKVLRAEPISALYSLGRIHHVGSFPKLEGQMCQITSDGYHGNGSPDRVDAMVYGLTNLFGPMTRRPLPPGASRPSRTVARAGMRV
jgi:phage terminase large subunit-like protein